MPRVPYKIAAALFCAVTPLSLLKFCQYVENPSSSFETYADMESAGIIEAGWVPHYIPKSASDIEETHNLDTNLVHVTFTYEPGDIGQLDERCQPIRHSGYVDFICDSDGSHRRGTVTLYDDGRGTYTNATDGF